MDRKSTAAEERRLKRLGTAVRHARLALLWESLWPRLAPLLTIVALFVAFSWLGLWRIVPDLVRLALLIAFGLATLAALIPVIRIRLPSAAQALTRVERASHLDHRPASGLLDRLSPVSDDAGGRALWAAHRARLLATIGVLKVGLPRPDLIRRDPHALRFVVPLLAIVAFPVAWDEHGLRLQEAFAPLERPAGGVPTRIDAWIDPPAYTGQPPVFLTRREGSEPARAVRVPESSRLTVRVVSEDPPEVAIESPAGTAALDAAEGAARATGGSGEGGTLRSYEATLERDGAISIRSGGREAAYPYTVIPDLPPTIERGPVTRNRAGSFTLDFLVRDDYGVTGGSVAFNPTQTSEDARPLVEPPEVAMRIARPGSRETTARAFARIEDHPFAGLEVTADAMVTDAAGQEGRPADDGRMELPARPFRNPIARALIEQRQILALDAGSQFRVAAALDAMTLWPERFVDSASIYLGLVVGHRRLLAARTEDDLRKMLDYLWVMARTIEDGDLSDVEERLQAAREALEEALASGAPDDEIARLTEELRQALHDYLQAFAQEMLRRGGEMADMPLGEQNLLSQQDLDRMLDRLGDLARLGDRDAAQQLLNELQAMLDNLQMGRPGQMDGQMGQMMEQMEELGRLMREQQRLMDETMRLDQRQGPVPRGPQGQEPMSPSQLAEMLRQLQEGQQDLRYSLQELLDQLGEGQAGQMAEEGMPMMRPGQQQGERALGRAGRAMDDAAQALGRGETGPAHGSQGDAMQALREGLESMMQDMFSEEMGDFGMGSLRGRTDPLGRPHRTQGPDFGRDVQIPDEIDVERARRILNAIRERLGERYRPRFELDYLERLLQPH